jgi:hypothetical protein
MKNIATDIAKASYFSINETNLESKKYSTDRVPNLKPFGF